MTTNLRIVASVFVGALFSAILIYSAQPMAKPSSKLLLGKWCLGDRSNIEITSSQNEYNASAVKVVGDTIEQYDNNAPSTGTIDTILTPLNDSTLYASGNDSDCGFAMNLYADKLYVRENQMCSGVNASFDGVYSRCD